MKQISCLVALVAAFSCPVLFSAPAPVSAPRSAAARQTPVSAGAVVRQIVIRSRGEIPFDESFVRGFLSVQEGAPIDRESVSADVKALLNSNRFSFADATIEPISDGVRVVFDLTARRVLATAPEFSGLSAVSRSRARKTVDLKVGDFVDDAVVASAAAKLRALYRQRRYFDAKVTSEIAPAGGIQAGASVTFVVDEGERVRMAFPEFPGARSISEDDLGRYAQLHSWFNPQSWFITPRIAPEDLDAMRADARKQYLDAGYLDVEVAPPEIRSAGGKRHVSYAVREGGVYHVGPISFTGVKLFPESALRTAAGIRTGDVAGASAIEAARTAVHDYYASRGYPDTVVETAAIPAKGAEVSLSFRVSEGRLVHLRDIRIRGNTITKEKVILREIGLNPGDPYDTVQSERSRRRLMNLGYFEDVRTYDSAAGDDLRDLFFEVDEKATGNVFFGAGFSSVDHLIGMFGISQSNFDLFNWPTFRGAGQKARLDLTVSGDSSDLDISFVEPWFLDRRLSLDVDAWLHTREYNEYDERRLGASAGLAKFVSGIGRLGLDYGLESVHLKDVTRERFHLLDDPEREWSFRDEDDSYLLGWLRLSWTYDTRDNPLVPRRGTRANVWGKLHNGALGSDYDFYETGAKAFHYIPTPFGTTLALSGMISTVDGMGGDEVPIGSRYFLGGGRNIRGFRHRDLGPKAISDDYEGDFSPIGGKTKLWATAEWSVPLAERIRFATFYDVGNVWNDEWDADLGDLASSVGIGLRLDFVGFPIRLDYAKAVDEPDDWVRTRRFVFWIGFDN